ncbi:hypothetical protein NDU88_001798 [Pleurodeles waltl]|uniref:Secreted protein n=1 Tax=Pleurodeles waltl TaxID=8319 RepID=A0AAV7P4Z4_PLEWA|nr:hypothetical protein NDU88_001798 [Pleurodeles waltl]
MSCSLWCAGALNALIRPAPNQRWAASSSRVLHPRARRLGSVWESADLSPPGKRAAAQAFASTAARERQTEARTLRGSRGRHSAGSCRRHRGAQQVTSIFPAHPSRSKK